MKYEAKTLRGNELEVGIWEPPSPPTLYVRVGERRASSAFGDEPVLHFCAAGLNPDEADALAAALVAAAAEVRRMRGER